MLAGGGGLGARYACTQARLDGVGEAGRGRAGCTARRCAAFDRRLTQENFPNPFPSGSGAPVAHPGIHARPAAAAPGHQARKPGKAGVESGGCVFRRRRTYDGRTPPHAHARRRSPHTICLQFVDDTGAVRLGDFGLAIDAGTETPFSRSGTLDYMAPEAMPLFLEGEHSANRHLWHAERVVHQECRFLRFKPLTSQVLANPTVDLDEGPGVCPDDLKRRGVRPYDEKATLMIR